MIKKQFLDWYYITFQYKYKISFPNRGITFVDFIIFFFGF